MQNLYRFFWLITLPILPLYLKVRQLKGKEDKNRINERYGYARYEKNKKSKILWLHAASIGEVNSILPLIEYLHQRQSKKYNFLLTTASRNGQMVAEKSAPSYVMVQYLPLDYSLAAKRFVQHYQPFAALWVEQELWPNLLSEAKQHGTHLALINGRLTKKSMRHWQRLGSFSKNIAGYFDCVLASSPQDRDNFKAIGFNADYFGNLKALPKHKIKASAKNLILPTDRKFWLAASLHKGEDILCFEAHRALQRSCGELFLLLVPRYPAEARAMQESAKRLNIKAVLHSESSASEIASADCLIIDGFGLLRDLYRLCDVAFLGGSMGAKILGSDCGGHNPLEAVMGDCLVLSGFDMHNFSDVSERLRRVGSLHRVDSVARSLQDGLRVFLWDDLRRRRCVENGKQVLSDLSAEAESVALFIENWLEERL